MYGLGLKQISMQRYLPVFKKKLFSSFAHITIVTKSSNMKINPKIHITKHVRKSKK